MLPTLPRWVYTLTGALTALLVFLSGDSLIPAQWKVYILAAISLLHLFVDPVQNSSGPKVPPLPLLFVLIAFPLSLAISVPTATRAASANGTSVVTGCAWLSANKKALEPLAEDACVLGAVDAGMSNDDAAAFCRVTVGFVESLLAQKTSAKHKATAQRQLDAGKP